MAENENEISNSRSENSKKLKEIEKATKAILQAFKNVEDATGEIYMPEGEYLGIKFED